MPKPTNCIKARCAIEEAIVKTTLDGSGARTTRAFMRRELALHGSKSTSRRSRQAAGRRPLIAEAQPCRG